MQISINKTLPPIPSVAPETTMSFDEFSKSLSSRSAGSIIASPKTPELLMLDVSKSHRLNHEKEHVMGCMSCANFMHKWKVTHDYGRKEGHRQSCAFCAHMHSVCKGSFVIPPYTTYDYCQFSKQEADLDDDCDAEMVDNDTYTALDAAILEFELEAEIDELFEDTTYDYCQYSKQETDLDDDCDAEMVDNDTCTALDAAILEFELEAEIDELFEDDSEVTYDDIEEIEVVDHDMTDNHHVSYCDECTKTRYTMASHRSFHDINNDEHVKYCYDCTFDKYSQPFDKQAHGFNFSQWHMDRCQHCTHYAQQLKREGRFEAVAEKLMDLSDDEGDYFEESMDVTD